MLESYMHEENGFLTLTYAPEHLPSDLSVNPRHLQLYLKRLRKAVYPKKFRFFGVGEYGERTERPHYHLALFGIGFSHEKEMKEAWDFGHILLGDFNAQSAGYVCGYVVKKMTKTDHYTEKFLRGRHPEFSRMSRCPGIAVPALDSILDVLTSPSGIDLMASGDVPYCLRHGSKILPLGRFLRSKLREMYGIKNEILEAFKKKNQIELQAMCLDFIANKKIINYEEDLKNAQEFLPSSKQTFFERQAFANLQAERNAEAQYSISKRKKRGIRI